MFVLLLNKDGGGAGGSGSKESGRGLVGMGEVGFEEGRRVVHPLGIPGVVLPQPGDEVTVSSVMLDKDKTFPEILET